MQSKSYPFLAKNLMWMVVIMFSVLTFGILLPFTLPFAIMAIRAKITLHADYFQYTMLFATKIPYKEITALKILPYKGIMMDKGQQALANQLAGKIIPLEISYGNGKKKKLSVNKFAQYEEILSILQQKTGLKLEIVA